MTHLTGPAIALGLIAASILAAVLFWLNDHLGLPEFFLQPERAT